MTGSKRWSFLAGSRKLSAEAQAHRRRRTAALCGAPRKRGFPSPSARGADRRARAGDQGPQGSGRRQGRGARAHKRRSAAPRQALQEGPHRDQPGDRRAPREGADWRRARHAGLPNRPGAPRVIAEEVPSRSRRSTRSEAPRRRRRSATSRRRSPSFTSGAPPPTTSCAKSSSRRPRTASSTGSPSTPSAALCRPAKP